MRLGDVWFESRITVPPRGVWFFGRYNGEEVMPTFIFQEGICISVRMEERSLKVVQHIIAFPQEWRP